MLLWMFVLLCVSSSLVETHTNNFDTINTLRHFEFSPLSLLDEPDSATFTIDFDEVITQEPDPIDFASELGPCICDLTFFRCDVNCDCDTDCTTSEKSIFSDLLEEGPKNLTIQRCVDEDLVTTNARDGILYTMVDNLLCVQATNNAKIGDYFDPPGAITAGMFISHSSALDYSFATESLTQSGSTQSVYKQGDALIAARSVSESLIGEPNNFFSLPDYGFSSQCEDGNFAYFLEPKRTRCCRTVTDLANSCYSQLNAALFTTDLRVGKTPSSSPDTESGYVDVTIGSIQIQDPISSVLSSLTTLPSSSYNTSSCICSNAIIAVDYVLSYSEDGQVTAAVANVCVGEASALNSICEDIVTGSVIQEYAISFTRDWVNTDISRPKSGNPGYRVGLPVLAGVLQTVDEKTGVLQDQSGLRLASASGSGECGNTSLVVNFGQDMLSSCYVELSDTQLEERCRNQGVLEFLTLNADVIGEWGNSDLHNQYEWIIIDKSSPATAYDWTASRLQCSGIINSMNIEFLTVELGSVTNPQPKIVAARTNYFSTTWSKSAVTNSSRFEVRVSATFIRIDATGTSEVMPPIPPLLPQLPYDVLYPLIMNAAHRTTIISLPYICCLAVILVYLT